MLRKFRRGRVWYVRGSVRGQGVYESAGTADEERAEAYRIKREGEVWDGRALGKRAAARFIDAADAYTSGRDLGRQDSADVLRLAEHFGRWKIANINQNALDSFCRKHFKDVSAYTVTRHAIAPLSAIMHLASRRGWCDRPKYERPKLPAGRVRWLTHAEAERLTSGAAMHLQPLLTFLLNTGARIGEAMALSWREVDLKARRIVFLDTKNGTNRGVPLNDAAWLALANLQGREGAVFRRPDGLPYEITEWRSGNIERAFGTACKRAGINDFRPHDCRHTFASWCVMAGVPLRTVAELLGHKTLNMVLRYSHLSTEHLQEAVNKIGRAPNVQTPRARRNVPRETKA